jgi:hypothetical protein
VAKLVVCNPRKNALIKDGNKSDRCTNNLIVGAMMLAPIAKPASPVMGLLSSI